MNCIRINLLYLTALGWFNFPCYEKHYNNSDIRHSTCTLSIPLCLTTEFPASPASSSIQTDRSEMRAEISVRDSRNHSCHRFGLHNKICARIEEEVGNTVTFIHLSVHPMLDLNCNSMNSSAGTQSLSNPHELSSSLNGQRSCRNCAT